MITDTKATLAMYAVQAVHRRNKNILNPRTHHWWSLRLFEHEAEAAAYLEELRNGAREAQMPYNYRLVEISQ